jgi:hypothetical protein
MSPKPGHATEEKLEENKEILIRALHWKGEEGLKELKEWLHEEFRKEDARGIYMYPGEQYLTMDRSGGYEFGAKHSRRPYAFDETHVCEVYWPEDKDATIVQLYEILKPDDGSIVSSVGVTQSAAMEAADTV